MAVKHVDQSSFISNQRLGIKLPKGVGVRSFVVGEKDFNRVASSVTSAAPP